MLLPFEPLLAVHARNLLPILHGEAQIAGVGINGVAVLAVLPAVLEHGGDDAVRVRILVQPDDIIGEIVHDMDAAAENIEDDVVAVEFVTVYHKFLRNEQCH